MFATFQNDKIIDLFDVVSMNRYYGWYIATGDLDVAEMYLQGDIQGWIDRTGKPIMMTEYGADTQPGVHSIWDAAWTEEYQRDYLAMNHRVFDRFPQFVGEQVWNFADFATIQRDPPRGGQQEGRLHARPQTQGGRSCAPRPVARPRRLQTRNHPTEPTAPVPHTPDPHN